MTGINFFMSNYFFVLLTLLVGCCFPVMASSNGILGRSLGSPLVATLSVFILGGIILVLLIALTKTPVPSKEQVKGIDWKVWLGGCIVILNVVTFTIVPGRIGISNMIVLFICGQLVASVAAEHFGWLRFPVHMINWQRMAGVCFLIAGVVLVKKF